MIAVRAMYQKGRIKLLEPAPKTRRTEVMVIFPEAQELAVEAMEDADRALLTRYCEELEPLSAEAERAVRARED